MQVVLSREHLARVEQHGERSYPNEGAGFLLGHAAGDTVTISAVLPLENRREAGAQHNRYELAPQDYLRAELEAATSGLSLVGVFHSHPDHPAQPSEFDREHALPHFSYLITSVRGGRAGATHAWRLREDRSGFDEDTLTISQEEDTV